MATSRNKDAETQQEETKPAETSLAVQGSTALTVSDMSSSYEEDAGAGMEKADADSYAIPFLVTLQKTSPQVDEASGKALDGAKAGMFFNNVNQEMIDGKTTGVEFIQCFFKREFLRWAPREMGGGFKGALPPEEIAVLRQKNQIRELDGKLYAPDSNGAVDPKRSDRFSDTRAHFVIYKSPKDGEWHHAMISLASTQVKKSRQLMASLADVKFTKANGDKFQPPSFANVVKMTSVPESNESGNWMGVRFEIVGRADDQAYKIAKAFYLQAKAGAVEAKYDGVNDEPAGSGNAERAPSKAGEDVPF